MKVEEMKQLINKRLSKSRYDHTIRVYEEAMKLCKSYNGNIEEVTIASLFHDLFKNDKEEDLRKYIVHYNLPNSLLESHSELWHGPVAAEYVKRELKIDNMQIYNAIYYHTTGRPHMQLTEKIVFIADYIEPQRSFPGIEYVRKLAYKNLDHAIHQSLKLTIQFLQNKSASIDENTYAAYEYYDLK